MFQFTREFIINDLNGKLKAKSNEHISSTLFGTNNKGRFAITEYKKDSKTVKKELMIDNFINSGDYYPFNDFLTNIIICVLTFIGINFLLIDSIIQN